MEVVKWIKFANSEEKELVKKLAGESATKIVFLNAIREAFPDLDIVDAQAVVNNFYKK